MDDEDKTPDIVQATLIGVVLQYLGTTEKYERLTQDHVMIVVSKVNSLIDGLKIVDYELKDNEDQDEDDPDEDDR
jgi:hypothetical protein